LLALARIAEATGDEPAAHRLYREAALVFARESEVVPSGGGEPPA
jgi:hypothetical protein